MMKRNDINTIEAKYEKKTIVLEIRLRNIVGTPIIIPILGQSALSKYIIHPIWLAYTHSGLSGRV